MRTESAREVSTIGTRAPSTMPGGIGMGEEGQVLRQHVAGLEIGHDEDLRAARDRRLMPLIRAASGSMALSKASGPSSRPPVIWPRSAILHSAAASIVEGIFGRHRLDRRQDRDARRAEPDRRARGRWRSGRCRAWRRGRGRC